MPLFFSFLVFARRRNRWMCNAHKNQVHDLSSQPAATAKCTKIRCSFSTAVGCKGFESLLKNQISKVNIAAFNFQKHNQKFDLTIIRVVYGYKQSGKRQHFVSFKGHLMAFDRCFVLELCSDISKISIFSIHLWLSATLLESCFSVMIA